MIFPDHHVYSEKDIERIAGAYHRMYGKNKVIVTTEKDAMRLVHPEFIKMLKH